MKQKKKNVLKIISVSLVLLFSLIVAGGMLRAYQTSQSFDKPTQQQVETARTIIVNDLNQRGYDHGSYELEMDGKARIVHKENFTRRVTQASIFGNSSRQAYLIDIDSGSILMHSKTEFYGWMANSSGKQGFEVNSRRWFHSQLMRQKP